MLDCCNLCAGFWKPDWDDKGIKKGGTHAHTEQLGLVDQVLWCRWTSGSLETRCVYSLCLNKETAGGLFRGAVLGCKHWGGQNWVLYSMQVFCQHWHMDQEKALPSPWIWDIGISDVAVLMSVIHVHSGLQSETKNLVHKWLMLGRAVTTLCFVLFQAQRKTQNVCVVCHSNEFSGRRDSLALRNSI